MITEIETNRLYLSECLAEDFPLFYSAFKKVLTESKINFDFIENTNDVWAVDYMPIQISKNEFVQFSYNPDYLIEYPDLITDTDLVCKSFKELKITKSKLVVDGGNVIRGKDKVIMCDKVFHENEKLEEGKIIEQLEEFFQVSKIIFVPWDLDDFTGHADGMVRFIDDDTVLINKYLGDNPEFETSFRMSLRNAGIKWEELPYNPQPDPTCMSARGLYLNYLQMEQGIIMPTYNFKSDEKAFKVLENIFQGQKVFTVESSELAREGGVLNCITWNILQ